MGYLGTKFPGRNFRLPFHFPFQLQTDYLVDIRMAESVHGYLMVFKYFKDANLKEYILKRGFSRMQNKKYSSVRLLAILLY